jgi:hypothetical protein
MADSIPDLIAEARKPSRPEDFASNEDETDYWRHLSRRLAVALESSSAPPASDNEREALADAIHDYRVGSDAAWTTHVDDEGIVHSEDHGFADAILAAGFRRLSPLTREALAKIASDWLIENKTSNQRNADEQGAGIADAILSSLSMPEPAEVVGIPWASTQPVEKGAEQ